MLNTTPPEDVSLLPVLLMQMIFFFFTNSSTNNLQQLFYFLKMYELESGQLVNASKSCFIVSDKTPLSVSSSIASTTGFIQKQLPYNYLECTIFKGRKKRCYFEYLINFVQDRLAGWQCWFLSFGGRIVLIKSTLLAIPIFCMQALASPKSILAKIHQLCNDFLWGKGNSLWTRFMRQKYAGTKHMTQATKKLHSSDTWNRINCNH